MNIIVNSPLMGDRIVETLTSYTEDGVVYKFISKTGMRMKFETNQTETGRAIDLTKTIIRRKDFAVALYFQVTIE